MQAHSWIEGFQGAVTVCDTRGVILEMNDAAAEVFMKSGGKSLIGSNVLDCHPESARAKLQSMMDEQRVNVYTTEKNGKKRLIYQSPWYENGEYKGFVEIGVDVPGEIPNFIRN